MKLKAVFLDKDGTLVPDIPYNIDTNKVTLSEGVIEGLQTLQSHGYLLIIVSNKSGAVSGFFSEEQLNAVRERLSGMCSKMGIYLDGFYNSNSRDGELLFDAADDKDIDLTRSWMIGDILNVVETGNKAGCKSVLIHNGNETEWKSGDGRMPEYFAKDLAEAAKYIVAATNLNNTEKKLERKAKYASA